MSSYDFNKRGEEFFEYSHSYDYLGGVGLGKSEVDAANLRTSQLGTYDMDPVKAPSGWEQIVKTATLISKAKNRKALLDKISTIREPKIEFVWNESHTDRRYFEWALHCIDRQVVGWQTIVEKPHLAAEKGEKPEKFLVGDFVQISNIKARPELNGKIGRIASISDRFSIEFGDISQNISIARKNLSLKFVFEPLGENVLPPGLSVDVCRLSSETGQKLNGQSATVVSNDGERYTVRLTGGELKSLKRENLHVPLPPLWTEHVDASTGSVFYKSGNDVVWKHPLIAQIGAWESLIRKRRGEFDRSAFLRDESKRLKLDQQAKLRGIKEEEVEAKIQQIGAATATFSGTPGELAKRLVDTPDTSLFHLALSIILTDYKSLKFNKSQLAALAAKIDDWEENEGPTPEIQSWIIGALQVANPIRYDV